MLASDLWYVIDQQRQQMAKLCSNPPAVAVIRNNSPREKRNLDFLENDLTFNEGNTKHKPWEGYLADLGGRKCGSKDCVEELKDMKIQSVSSASPEVQSLPKASEAEPTTADEPTPTLTLQLSLMLFSHLLTYCYCIVL